MVRPGFYFVLACLAAGCASDAKRAASPAATPEPGPPQNQRERAVVARDVTLAAPGEDRKPVWTVKAKQTRLDVFTDDNVTTTLNGVTGEIFQDGKPAVDYSGNVAYANRVSKKLRIEGDVVLKQKGADGTVRASAAQWWPTAELIELRGDVSYKGNGWIVEPVSSLWVTPDFKIIGTYEAFKRDSQMNKLIASLAIAPTLLGAGVSFRDTQGNMSLTNLTRWISKRAAAKTIGFEGAGRPFLGVWKSQGMRVNGNTLSGTAVEGSKGYYLSKLDAAGNVRVALVPVGRNVKQEETIITGSRFEFEGNETDGKATLTGGVRVVNRVGIQREIIFTGTRADLTLNLRPGTETPVTLAQVAGPITFRLVDKERPKVLVVDGSASRVDYKPNENGSTVTLTGNVIVKGEEGSGGGEMSADRVVIELDAKGEVTSMTAEGNPGSGTFQDPT